VWLLFERDLGSTPRVKPYVVDQHASHEYEATGLQILELAQSAYSLYVTQNPQEQARLVKNRTAASTAEVFVPPTESPSTCSRKELKREIGSPHWTISATG
jgi:hypothetical protein